MRPLCPYHSHTALGIILGDGSLDHIAIISTKKLKGNWKTWKRGNGNGNGNGNENGNGNNLKDLENVSQFRGHTLAKSLR